MVPGAQASLKEDWVRSRLRLWPHPLLHHWPTAQPQQLSSQWPPCSRAGQCFLTTFQMLFVQGKERDADSPLLREVCLPRDPSLIYHLGQ